MPATPPPAFNAPMTPVQATSVQGAGIQTATPADDPPPPWLAGAGGAATINVNGTEYTPETLKAAGWSDAQIAAARK